MLMCFRPKELMRIFKASVSASSASPNLMGFSPHCHVYLIVPIICLTVFWPSARVQY
jgi:hypothetical protein